MADSISNAFVGVAEAADVRRATTLIWAYAEDRASFMLAPTSCGLTKWFSTAADEEDSILQSLPIIPELLNLAEEELNSAEDTFTLESSLVDCSASR